MEVEAYSGTLYLLQEIDGGIGSLFVGMADIRACLMCPFVEGPDDSVAHPALVVRDDHGRQVLLVCRGQSRSGWRDI